MKLVYSVNFKVSISKLSPIINFNLCPLRRFRGGKLAIHRSVILRPIGVHLVHLVRLSESLTVILAVYGSVLKW